MALYALASQLPKDLSDEEITSAVCAVYPAPKEERPQLPQSIYAFISAELVLAKTEEYCHSVEHMCASILEAYKEARLLPNEFHQLEIAIWKFLTESEQLLEKLPYRIGHKIEEELANILIDYPQLSFGAIIQKATQFFQQMKELSLSKKWPEIERKIHNWAIQNEMIYRSIHLDSERPLLQLIKEKSELKGQALICEVAHIYLTQHPELLTYASQLQLRIQTLYKYTWYTQLGSKEESSFDRFLKWHASSFLSSSPYIEDKQLVALLEELCKKVVPLMPFDSLRCVELIKEEKSKQNKGQAQVLAHV